MKLSHLLASFPGINVIRGSDSMVESITDDSRQVAPGSLFIARRGSVTDGRAFIEDALSRGASAVVEAAPTEAVALAHAFYGHPASSLRMVGITGTNGKTTTSFLLQQLLSTAGSRCALIGTVLTDDGATRTPSSLTTPGACELAALLARMVCNDCAAVAMEVSSHALDQGRVDGIEFSVGVFTNLTGDHLDYHETMDAYASAKAMLFAGLRGGDSAVVNADDPWHESMVRNCKGRVIRCSIDDPGAECVARIVRGGVSAMDVELRGPWGEVEVTLPFVGAHNAMNAIEAAAAAWALGVGREGIAIGLANAKAPPGRLERVSGADSPFAVLVDYAHTDDALLNVLSALRKVAGTGRIITVFGCGGDRDRTKRPRMMRTAAEYSDHVIVTSDNPRTEDPAAIIAEILVGTPEGSATIIESDIDRTKAIRRAVSLANAGDIVLIAGKGHEDYQIIGREKRPFDDRAIAREALGQPHATRALTGVHA
ncbi:MAG: UDP-N-acetylmuramoyl-L-alanyl-D-glutamate--2,6-diaminopimelate ligase [Phycisphaerales bacterium]|nr:UDP-N-acetylmuramoyl-L-alanyl-D-glutamate--2,6-diaminopimelate ligase [Phycisphaerales bacterium]